MPNLKQTQTTILGPASAGKTCLREATSGQGASIIYATTVNFAKSLSSIHFPQKDEQIQVKLANSNVQTVIWDYGGQTLYRDTIKDTVTVGGAIIWVIDSTILEESLSELIDEIYPMVKEEYEKIGLEVSTSSTYISKILEPGSSEKPRSGLFCVKNKEINTELFVQSDLLYEIYGEITDNIPTNQSVFVGDTVGYKGIVPVMYCTHGPRGKLSEPIPTNLGGPINLANIHSIQAEGLGGLIKPRTPLEWLKRKRLLLPSDY